MLIKKILRYYHTSKYLKFKQIYYRIYYFARKKWRNITGFRYAFSPEKVPHSRSLTLLPSIPTHTSFSSENTFQFLNLKKTFDLQKTEGLPWNFGDYGNLWRYNLTYFEYLNQENMPVQTGCRLIDDFIQNFDEVFNGLEPFPIALRAINWIKFVSKNDIRDPQIDQSLYHQIQILKDSLEYQLLGNHILENAFALLFAAYYFSDEQLYVKAKSILLPELEEQTLSDGGHFELCPMYHQMMLYRILDCINVMKNNPLFDNECQVFFEEKAELMLGWLREITFENGAIPLLSDSTIDIAPTSAQLFDYAARLNIQTKTVALKESGYRKFQSADYECIIDVGNIGPDYIPGHAHSDTFNFVMQAKGLPFIVDTGISTYWTADIRQLERQTSSHNTVQIGEEEQSEIWRHFRVARRAKITHLNETKNTVKASHNGYARIGAIHTREFIFSEKKIVIKDIVSTKKNRQKRAFIHFHPDVKVALEDNAVKTNFGKIRFEGSKNVELASYLCAKGFNNRVEARKIIVTFAEDLETKILFDEQ